MFVDSSALVAMILPEPDGQAFASRLQESGESFTSPVAIFETTLALRRMRGAPLAEVVLVIEEFLRRAGSHIVQVDADDHIGALQAFEMYGKGTGSPAQLNLSDCFAYAVAKRLGVPLLYKGYDFAHTDLA
ncbi:type II toxin-antitoxin system VapC family toxin [Mesorhizobium marinum]|uniref:type II toxin-antitoxin system VapC family toxin n=1 Tax=Mesorhizobium marinum TaxID=3228790 RepID=UPI003467DAA2